MNYFVTLISLLFLLVAHADPVLQQLYTPELISPFVKSCNDIGDADSYVLVLSLQPGFCETYGYEEAKPECFSLTEDSYQATHLTLHGLWPNKKICGPHYGFCQVSPRENHCAYAPLVLSSAVAEQLNIIMPSYYYGSCLERHEWNKHGSCQTLTPNDYFALAMRLTTEIDQSDFGRYLTDHHGELVSLLRLRELINDSFGEYNGSKFYLGCRNGILVDIFIQLPAVIPFEEPVSSLINEASNIKHHDGCPSTIKISNFRHEH